ncbi:hypothetical protein K8R33_01795 [archaeon]|nr:hypothetical protein [archaeon]
MNDTLQKKLQEMEKESSSPSLEGVKPTLKERAYFLTRYLSKSVEHITGTYTILRDTYLDLMDEETLYLSIGKPIRVFGDLSDDYVTVSVEGKTFEARVSADDAGNVSFTGSRCAPAGFIEYLTTARK